MHLRAARLQRKERRNDFIVKLKVKNFSFSYHGLYCQFIIDVVTIQEQVVFQFLSHGKHAQLLWFKLLDFSFIFYQFLNVQHFEIGNCAVVFSLEIPITISGVSDLKSQGPLLRSRFCFKFLRCVVCIICYRVIDQADGHAVVEPCLVDEECQ